jgi:hypothetical protein
MADQLPCSPPPITICCALFGARQIVEPCLRSWLPLPNGWQMDLVVSKVCELDGTDTAAALLAKDYPNVQTLPAHGNLSHGNALDRLMEQLASDQWALVLDSDVECLDRAVCQHIEGLIRSPAKARVFGLQEVPGPYWPHRFHLPRVSAWCCLVHAGWFRERQLSFLNIICPLDLTRAIGDKKLLNLLRANPNGCSMGGDTGWEVYARARAESAFAPLPSSITSRLRHYQASSRNWWQATSQGGAGRPPAL